ncbi:putative Syntaxin protein [Balamuthia mandrillaris]
MNDRMKEFLEATASSGSVSESDIEMTPRGSDRELPEEELEKMDELKDFLKDIEEMKEDMQFLTKNLVTLKRLFADILTTTSTEQIKKLKRDASKIREEMDNTAQEMRVALKRIRKENDQFTKEHNNDPSLCRIRVNMHGSVVRKFMDLMSEYQLALTEADSQSRKAILRQVKLVKPDATQEELDEILEQSPDAAEAIFQRQIMEDRKHEDAVHALDFLKEKQNDIKNLEKSIVELQQLFMDMSILVETQGDLIDQIEHSVSQTKAYTETAVKDLAISEKRQCMARRRQICILVLCIVLIVVVIAVAGILGGIIPTSTS